jgi:uncharacterized protein
MAYSLTRNCPDIANAALHVRIEWVRRNSLFEPPSKCESGLVICGRVLLDLRTNTHGGVPNRRRRILSPIGRTMSQTETLPKTDTSRDWVPYAVPMVAFLVLTTLEGQSPKLNGAAHPVYYPLAYAFKIAVAAATAWYCRSAWRDFRPRPSAITIVSGAALGIIVTALWVGLDGRYPSIPLLGTRSAFDPSALAPAGRIAFVTVRLFGLVLLVPLIEELFWRSFLMRLIINPDFRTVPIGTVTPLAAAITSAMFAAAHPEWLPAFLTGLIWAALLWRTKSLTACLISHATANLSLGVYVLATGNWKFL